MTQSQTNDKSNIRSSMKEREKREKDKPLHLPCIIKSIENNQDSIINDEYQDTIKNVWQTSINDARSLISFSNDSRSYKDYSFRDRKHSLKKRAPPSSDSKSQVSRRKNNKINKKYSDFMPLDSEDASLTKYIKKIYRNQKWSFVKFEKNK